jgi:hypothetical protein
MGGVCGTNGREVNCVKGLGKGSGSKEPIGRIRCRWGNNIKVNLEEVGRRGVSWINLA